MSTRFFQSNLAQYPLSAVVVALSLSAASTSANIQTVTSHAVEQEAMADFTSANVPTPTRSDAASSARFTIVDGRLDANSGGLVTLHDGRVPADADDPAGNFFFASGTEGGRLVVDLGRAVEIKQINSFSWHPSTRGPQVYKLYASEGGEFNARPAKVIDPATCGWKWIADVDTRSRDGRNGGQYGVSISDTDGPIGAFQFLLFDIAPTETSNAFGNTFYSEIDVVEANGPAPVAAVSPAFVVPTADGACQITINASGAPELASWTEHTLAPVLSEWYSRIVELLPSEDYVPPKQFSVTLRPGNGVASTSGMRITANSDWIERELKGEALGALVHEVVHVVQQYRGRREPGAQRMPGWLVEGIPDYIRWFVYEPQSHGADLLWLQSRRNVTFDHEAGYRMSANFLNYVVMDYGADQNLIAIINAAGNQGTYNDELWVEMTGKSLQELSQEWEADTQERLAKRNGSGANELTDAERAAGWKLLFNGEDFEGWHNFKREGVRPGWQVKDGALVCVDPHDAGDIVTTEMFGAFELELDYNISEGGNSGIIFHVTDEGGAVWATGPEFQLEDNVNAADPQRCGWLYALYQPPDDPATGKPIDATLPAGKWNHVRLVISPERCEHWINDVKYFEYQIGSEDFQARLAQSKFSRMPLFAKAAAGYIALQGDHGQITFRNIKIRSIPTQTARLNP